MVLLLVGTTIFNTAIMIELFSAREKIVGTGSYHGRTLKMMEIYNVGYLGPYL